MKKYELTEELINKIINYLGEGKLKETAELWLEIKRQCEIKPDAEPQIKDQ